MSDFERDGRREPELYVASPGGGRRNTRRVKQSERRKPVVPRPKGARRGASALARSVLRMPNETLEQLDAIVELVNHVGNGKLSRASVMRAGLKMWIEIAKTADPKEVIAAVLAAHVPRGRRKVR